MTRRINSPESGSSPVSYSFLPVPAYEPWSAVLQSKATIGPYQRPEWAYSEREFHHPQGIGRNTMWNTCGLFTLLSWLFLLS